MKCLPEPEEYMWVSVVASHKILSYKLRRKRASVLTSFVFVGGFLVVGALKNFLNLFRVSGSNSVFTESKAQEKSMDIVAK